MKKFIGMEGQTPKEILQMLQDNANETGQENFVRPYTPAVLAKTEQALMSGLKEFKKLTNKLNKIKKEYSEKLKPLKLENDQLLTNVELKGEMVLEEVFYFIDHEERKVGTYDASGNLISERPARADELQQTGVIFQMEPAADLDKFINPNERIEPREKTGTDDETPTSFGIQL